MSDLQGVKSVSDLETARIEAQVAEAGLRALAVALLEAQLADLEADVRVEAAA